MKRIKFEDPLAEEILNRGDVLSFPTETVFGLGVRYDNKSAFDKLVKIKNRAPDKPFTLMCGNKNDIKKYAYVDERIDKIISVFLPGPITLLLKVKESVPDFVTLGSDKIGIRIPGMEKLCNLINKVGVPLLVPSANKAGEKPALSCEDVINIFDGEIEAVIEEKIFESSVPSTIVDLSVKDEITLVRPGEINIEKLKEVFYS